MYQPSFFFLPTDLNFFLTYERQDQKRRRKVYRQTGSIPARSCPTAQTYQDHQKLHGVEGADLGGLYTRLVLTDFFPNPPGRAPFKPGLSEFGAIKSWTGSPMASLQRAVVMLRQLDLRGIPRHIRDGLRQLQDAYSEDINIDGSDTSSKGSIEAGRPEENDHEEVEDDNGGETKTETQQSRAGQRSVRGDTAQNDDQHEVNEEEARKNNSEDEDHSPEDTEVAISPRRLRHRRKYGEFIPNNSSLWKWGPGTTSNDAATFFRRVL